MFVLESLGMNPFPAHLCCCQDSLQHGGGVPEVPFLDMWALQLQTSNDMSNYSYAKDLS